MSEPCRAWGLSLSTLGHTYPGAAVPALSEISFRAEPGERVAIVGPNGAGKSTLLLHLNGILEPTTGSVAVGELPVTPENLDEVRRRVGLVFQDPDDQLFMPTLLEDAAFGPLCQGLGAAESESRARAALARVGLQDVDPGRAAHHLSGGERRRAALATVLSMDVGLLALDEPSAGLDGRGRRRLAEILRSSGQTVLVATHDVEFAAAVCPRALLLDAGRLVADMSAKRLLDDEDLLDRHGLIFRWAVRRNSVDGDE